MPIFSAFPAAPAGAPPVVAVVAAGRTWTPDQYRTATGTDAPVTVTAQ